MQTKDYIAYVRLTADDKANLDAITTALPGDQSAHIRQAVREYSARLLPTLAHLPPVVPATADPAEESSISLLEVGQ